MTKTKTMTPTLTMQQTMNANRAAGAKIYSSFGGSPDASTALWLKPWHT